MMHSIVAVGIMIALLLLYGAIMLFTDYIKVASYINVLFINVAWFYVATGYKGYDVYYPTVFDNKWLNLLLMTVGFMLMVYELSKFIKLRNSFMISTGMVSHLVICIMILNFCNEVPEWGQVLFVVISSLIVFGIDISAIYTGKNTEPGHIASRILAGILLMPTPFLITSAGLLVSKVRDSVHIEPISFDAFIQQIYDFIRNPEFNYSGRASLSNFIPDRKALIIALIVSLVVFIGYVIIDSTVDFRGDMKEKNRHRKAAAKERMRAETSSKIRAQLEKIDSCMSYISTNYKLLKVKDSDMRQLRLYYDEATRIKYSYNGAASDSLLKRLNEIRTEMFIIRDRIINHIDVDVEDEDVYTRTSFHTEENGWEEERKNKEAQFENDATRSAYENTGRSSEQEQHQERSEAEKPDDKSSIASREYVSTGFFNGCSTEEEIKKRYRDLTKVFHPDSGNGDQETFLNIKKDYDELMKRKADEKVS